MDHRLRGHGISAAANRCSREERKLLFSLLSKLCVFWIDFDTRSTANASSEWIIAFGDTRTSYSELAFAVLRVSKSIPKTPPWRPRSRNYWTKPLKILGNGNDLEDSVLGLDESISARGFGGETLFNGLVRC
jgi:hypothetical protein